MRIGVISDTHGLLRPEALAALEGAEQILHLGDVGNMDILNALSEIAPVTAIRGNVDNYGPCAELAAEEVVEILGHSLYLVHNIAELDLNPQAAGFAAVLYGHSHQPSLEWKSGVLYFNPGSAGPRRFQLPVALGWLDITVAGIEASHVKLL
jgi:uncharacterized protein